MSAQPTPGPWQVIFWDNGHGYGLYSRETFILSHAFESPQREDVTAREKADAALIAQSPALLEAGYDLCVLALQSEHYRTDADFREAVNQMAQVLRDAGHPHFALVPPPKPAGEARHA